MPQQHDGGAAPAADSAALPARRTSTVGNLVRGALIGLVETVPGVSGGTVALVVGIYAQLLESADHVVTAIRRLLLGPQRLAGAREHLAAVRWRLIIPVLIGMAAAVFTVAGPMAAAVENHPVLTRAAFFGMVLASLAVPLRMAGPGGLRMRHGLAGLAAAVLTFWLVSLPPTTIVATPATILPAAAVAVSALMLPGLSGSFLLLTVGLYEPTLQAVDQRDLGYLGIFAVGMVLGAIVLVKVLTWLLAHRRRMTLVVLAGLMLGALRSLWPWQTGSRALLAPDDAWLGVLGLGLAGFVVVGLLVALDARLARRQG